MYEKVQLPWRSSHQRAWKSLQLLMLKLWPSSSPLSLPLWLNQVPKTTFSSLVVSNFLFNMSFYFYLHTWAATMHRKTVSTLRKKDSALNLKPAIKYTTTRNNTGNIKSSGRSLVVLATKYALNLYIFDSRSLLSIALSWGNVNIAVNTGKNPQNTAMKKSSPTWDAERVQISRQETTNHQLQLISRPINMYQPIPDLVDLWDVECLFATRVNLRWWQWRELEWLSTSWNSHVSVLSFLLRKVNNTVPTNLIPILVWDKLSSI